MYRDFKVAPHIIPSAKFMCESECEQKLNMILNMAIV